MAILVHLDYIRSNGYSPLLLTGLQSIGTSYLYIGLSTRKPVYNSDVWQSSVVLGIALVFMSVKSEHSYTKTCFFALYARTSK